MLHGLISMIWINSTELKSRTVSPEGQYQQRYPEKQREGEELAKLSRKYAISERQIFVEEPRRSTREDPTRRYGFAPKILPKNNSYKGKRARYHPRGYSRESDFTSGFMRGVV